MLRRLPVGRMGALVRNIMAERRAELPLAVSEQLHIVCPARDGDIGHAVVEQVFRAKFRVHVDEHAVSGLSLAGMTCDRVAMIEARMRRRIKLDCTVFWTASVQLKLIRPSWPMPPRSRVHGWPASSRATARIALRQRSRAGRLVVAPDKPSSLEKRLASGPLQGSELQGRTLVVSRYAGIAVFHGLITALTFDPCKPLKTRGGGRGSKLTLTET